jgi:homoprotocatechuate degradation regulator HpaR
MSRVRKKPAARPRREGEDRGADTGSASRQLPVLLHRTREALAMRFRKVFLLHDLTDPQWRVLRILDQAKELDVTSLAEQSYLMGPSLSRILRDLAKRGLISRRVSSSDARRFFHTLTGRGHKLLDEVSPAFNPVYRDIEARFGVDRIRELNERLSALLEAIRSDADSAGNGRGD